MSSRLGELLQKRGLLTPEQLHKALEHQREHGGALATFLVKLGLVSEDHLLAFIEREYRLPVVDPLALEISRDVLNLVPQTLVTKHHLIPTNLARSTLTVAMADPSNVVAINEIKFLTGYDVKIAVASPAAIAAAIDRHYNNDANFDEVLSQLGNENVELVQDADDVDLAELEKATEEAPVVRLVNAVLTLRSVPRADDARTVVARYVRALQEGDLDTATSSFHPDATWHIPGNGRLAGDYVGPDAIFGDFYAKAVARFDPSTPSTLTLRSIVADGPVAIAQWRTTGRTLTGADYDNSYAVAFDVRDGKIAEVWEYLDTAHFEQALFG